MRTVKRSLRLRSGSRSVLNNRFWALDRGEGSSSLLSSSPSMATVTVSSSDRSSSVVPVGELTVAVASLGVLLVSTVVLLTSVLT